MPTPTSATTGGGSPPQEREFGIDEVNDCVHPPPFVFPNHLNDDSD